MGELVSAYTPDSRPSGGIATLSRVESIVQQRRRVVEAIGTGTPVTPRVELRASSSDRFDVVYSNEPRADWLPSTPVELFPGCLIGGDGGEVTICDALDMAVMMAQTNKADVQVTVDPRGNMNLGVVRPEPSTPVASNGSIEIAQQMAGLNEATQVRSRKAGKPKPESNPLKEEKDRRRAKNLSLAPDHLKGYLKPTNGSEKTNGRKPKRR